MNKRPRNIKINKGHAETSRQSAYKNSTHHISQDPTAAYAPLYFLIMYAMAVEENRRERIQKWLKHKLRLTKRKKMYVLCNLHSPPIRHSMLWALRQCDQNSHIFLIKKKSKSGSFESGHRRCGSFEKIISFLTLKHR